MLKAIVDDINTVPEVLREHYTQVGDQYVLDSDEKDFKGKISEFRTNNIDLAKKVTAMEAQLEAFKNIDPKKVPEAMKALEKLRELEEKNLIDAGKLDEVLTQRTERMRSDYDGKLNKLQELLDSASKERDSFKTRLSDTLVSSEISKTIADIATPRKGAMLDIISRAKSLWTVDETGALVPIRDGKVVYGADATKPLTTEEWGKNLFNEASYLFEPNSGGNSSGSNSKKQADGIKVLDWNDNEAIGSSIDDIAAGKIVLQRN